MITETKMDLKFEDGQFDSVDPLGFLKEGIADAAADEAGIAGPLFHMVERGRLHQRLELGLFVVQPSVAHFGPQFTARFLLHHRGHDEPLAVDDKLGRPVVTLDLADYHLAAGMIDAHDRTEGDHQLGLF